MGFPISVVITRPKCAFSASSIWAARATTAARSASGARRQRGKASCAAASFASNSSAVSSGYVRSVSPVAGLMVAMGMAGTFATVSRPGNRRRAAPGACNS
jgi:hypothetical protein